MLSYGVVVLIHLPAEISLLFWVDDSITATRSQAVFESFYAEISKQIDLTRSAVNSQFTFVGISVEYNQAKKTVFLHQTPFAITILQRFGLSDANPLCLPMFAQFYIHT